MEYYNMKDLVYCKKNYFKVQNNIDFEFKKGKYYYISNIEIFFDFTKKNNFRKKTKNFIIDGYDYSFNFTEKEFYEHFLSHEKTKRKLKLDRIKNNKKKWMI